MHSVPLHNYRPKSDYALTFIMGHRMGAFQAIMDSKCDPLDTDLNIKVESKCQEIKIKFVLA